MEWYEKLKLALESRGMTQKELAEAVMVSPQMVSKWVNGKNRPDYDKWPAIKEILGIDLFEHFKRANRQGGRKRMNYIKLSDITNYEEAKVKAKELLDAVDIANKYSYPVYKLLTWLLPATIGLKNHERINNKNADFEYDMSDVLASLRDYYEPVIIRSKYGSFKNELEREFYEMGADLFESGVENLDGVPIYIPDHEFVNGAINDWYNFDSAVIKDPASNVYSELLVAIMEIANYEYPCAGLDS